MYINILYSKTTTYRALPTPQCGLQPALSSRTTPSLTSAPQRSPSSKVCITDSANSAAPSSGAFSSRGLARCSSSATTALPASSSSSFLWPRILRTETRAQSPRRVERMSMFPRLVGLFLGTTGVSLYVQRDPGGLAQGFVDLRATPTWPPHGNTCGALLKGLVK